MNASQPHPRPSGDAQRRRYVEEMGRQPPVPRPGDPLAWQWEYAGSKAERERLAATLHVKHT